jgi:chromosome segregation ATPase
VPGHAKEIFHANIAFEQLHTELHFQSRRQDDSFERIAKAEADLGRVAKLTAENEGLHAAERQQKNAAIVSLTKRCEEALAACASLKRGLDSTSQEVHKNQERVDCLETLSVEKQEALLRRQEDLVQRVESLEALGEKQDKLVQRVESLESLREERQQALIQRVECLEAVGGEIPQVRRLQTDVETLQAEVRERGDLSSHAFRRLDTMEHIFEENTRMRQELAQMRRESERRDLEMATLQGQMGALTELVREQMSVQLGTHVRCSGA